jgi:hypothetical protein
MSAHLYLVGETVTLNPVMFSKRAEGYTVKAQLPPSGDTLQYRVKSDSEPFQRVVFEHQISSRPVAPPISAAKPTKRNPLDDVFRKTTVTT